jgi:beta-glucosidase
MHDAIARGVDLRGYYHWTLVDNFEWYSGWDLRFGLIELDERTQERTPRPSARLYSAIATANRFEEAWLDELNVSVPE